MKAHSPSTWTPTVTTGLLSCCVYDGASTSLFDRLSHNLPVCLLLLNSVNRCIAHTHTRNVSRMLFAAAMLNLAVAR